MSDVVPTPRMPMLVAALFCRDVIYDERRSQVTIVRIGDTYELKPPYGYGQRPPTYIPDDLWLLTIVDGMPRLMHDQDDPDEQVPDEMSIDVLVRDPDGEEILQAKSYMYPEGPLNRAISQMGFSLPRDLNGILEAEVSYQGEVLTVARLVLGPEPQQRHPGFG